MYFNKSTITFAVLLLMGAQSKAQLNIQSGATFTMQTGAQVTVQGNVENAGTLNNDGTLKVQGNYTNTGTYTAVGTPGILEIYGTGNSDITAGASPIANLLITKTAGTEVVTLKSTAVVNNTFTLTNGVFTTDPIANPTFSLTSPVTATFSFAAGKEIIGTVKRTSWTTGATRIFNNANMQVATNGGSAPTDLTVTMIPQTAGGDPTLAEREVKRKYTFTQTGGSGFTADVRFSYLNGELNTNLDSNLIPWRLEASEWNAKFSPVTRDTVNNYVATTGILATELAQEWKLADPNYTMNVTANLRGPWNGVSAMNTSLLAAGIIPSAQPYNIAPYNYFGTENVGVIPANVVDWILIELRKPSSGLPQDALFATITGSKVGFLLNNGTVVELDGITPIAIPIYKQGPAFITVRHRNHLGVLSNAIASNAAGTFTNDYTVLANVYKPFGASSDPVTLLPGAGGKYGLWAGDASKNGVVNGGDIITIKNAISILASGYQFADVNLNTATNGGDIISTKNTVSLLGTGSGTNSRPASTTEIVTPVKTNIPDPIIEN